MISQGWRTRLGLLLATASVLVGVGLAAPVGATVTRPEAGAAPKAGIPDGGVLKVCRCADAIAADPVTGTLWVAYGSYDKVLVFSERTLRLLKTFHLSSSADPVGMVADPKTGVVWVATLSHVIEISGRHLSILRTIKVQLSDGPREMAVDPKAGKVWVIVDQNYGRGGVQQIDEATGRAGYTVPVAPFAEHLTVDWSAGTVWATNAKVPVLEIREASSSVIAKLNIPGTTTGIAADPASGKVWAITNIYKPRVFEINAAQHRVVGQLPLRFWPPATIAADATTGTVWVAAGANHVSLISEGRQAVARTLRLGGAPSVSAIDPRSHMYFSLSYRDGTVTYYRYSAPRYTSASHASFVAGASGRFVVRTQGFPKAAMSLRGHLPTGLHATVSLGTIVIKGTPFSSDRLGAYRVEVTADNGIGTPRDSYVFVQHLVIRLR